LRGTPSFTTVSATASLTAVTCVASRCAMRWANTWRGVSNASTLRFATATTGTPAMRPASAANRFGPNR
jgi:hypothetical protein